MLGLPYRLRPKVARFQSGLPEEVPECCLIAVCLRKNAVVGVYKYECRREPP